MDDCTQVSDILIGSRAAFMSYAPSAHTEIDVRRWVREYLIPTGRVTLAQIDDIIAGVVATSLEEEVTWIDQMWVLSTEVGQGIGSMLLAHVLRLAAAKVRLYTFQENTGARRFYERYGFTAVKFTDGRNNEEHCPDVLYERIAQVPTL
jgi:GNAT superfamily N-acetyltransferase